MARTRGNTLAIVGWALAATSAHARELFVDPGETGARPTEVDSFAEIARPFLDQHCVRCHRDDSAESNHLDLASPVRLDLGADGPDGAADEWEWLLERVEFQEMPPSGEPQPDAGERERFAAFVRSALDSARGSEGVRGPAPLPSTGLHRLTREEYTNALRDLLGVRFDAKRWLPPDPVGHGFDHVTSAQSLSEAHFLRYLEAAEVAAERAVPSILFDGGEIRVLLTAEDLRGGYRHRTGRLLATNGAITGTVFLPAGGRYRVEAEVYGQQAGPEVARAVLVAPADRRGEVVDVPGTAEAPQVLSAEFDFARGGDREIGVRFVNDYYRKPTESAPGEDRNFVVLSLEIRGPLESTSGDELTPFLEGSGLADVIRSEAHVAEQLSGEPPEQERASSDAHVDLLRAVIGRQAALLWRRTDLDEETVDRLLALSSSEASVAERLRMALVGILASPRFLFVEPRAKSDAEADARRSLALDSASLATRLASFLWRSVPDAALLQRAADGVDPIELARDMLGDERADAFARSFGDQWLQLRGVARRRADRKRFPTFSLELRDAMLEETRRVFVRSMREERSLWEFIDGDETIVNGRLARHYDLAASAFEDARLPGRDEWRAASLGGTERRGLLGQGAVLFGTSEATRTSPVRRGKWVLDVLLGSAPPPPPPGADNLPPNGKGEEQLSFRERFESHRAEPVCASCHARMDPIGFGLERFDALGRVRPSAEGDQGPREIDVTGTLPDGRSFDGPLELVELLRGEDRFLEALAERLLIYGLGRGLQRADRGAVQAILSALDPERPTLREMVLAVVELDEFQRVAVEPEGEAAGKSTNESRDELEEQAGEKR